MHTCSHLIHTVQFVCVHCSSLTHINTHTHIHTSVYLAALFSLSCWKITVICLPFVQKEEGSSSSFRSVESKKGAIQTLSSPLPRIHVRLSEASHFCRLPSPPLCRPQSSCRWQSPSERWRPVWRRECVAECCWAQWYRWSFGWQERGCGTQGWTARRLGAAGLQQDCGLCRSGSRSLTSGWCWRRQSGPGRQTGTASYASGWVWPDTAGGWVQSAQRHTYR